MLTSKEYDGPVLTATGGDANDYGSDTVHVSTKSGVVELKPWEKRIFPMTELQLSTTNDGISWHVCLLHWGDKVSSVVEPNFEDPNMTQTGETGNKYWNKSYYYQVTDMTKDAYFPC